MQIQVAFICNRCPVSGYLLRLSRDLSVSVYAHVCFCYSVAKLCSAVCGSSVGTASVAKQKLSLCSVAAALFHMRMRCQSTHIDEGILQHRRYGCKAFKGRCIRWQFLCDYGRVLCSSAALVAGKRVVCDFLCRIVGEIYCRKECAEHGRYLLSISAQPCTKIKLFLRRVGIPFVAVVANLYRVCICFAEHAETRGECHTADLDRACILAPSLHLSGALAQVATRPCVVIINMLCSSAVRCGGFHGLPLRLVTQGVCSWHVGHQALEPRNGGLVYTLKTSPVT